MNFKHINITIPWDIPSSCAFFCSVGAVVLLIVVLLCSVAVVLLIFIWLTCNKNSEHRVFIRSSEKLLLNEDHRGCYACHT